MKRATRQLEAAGCESGHARLHRDVGFRSRASASLENERAISTSTH